MAIESMAAQHAAGKGSEPDAVFAVVEKIREAKKLPGELNIIDGSIGAMRDENGDFGILPVVDEEYRKLPADILMDYATIAGSPEFIQAAIDYTFQGFQPEGTFAAAVATPGGTGAIRLMVSNYLDKGDTLLIPDWLWSPYKTIASECSVKTESYRMFDENLQFSLESIKEKSQACLENQERLLIIFNTPGHNPTGYSMSDADWSELIPFYKKLAQDSGKNVVLGLDIAYIDYCGDPKESRRFLSMFTDLPENMQVLLAFSMSKSFFVYGMRSGAIISFHSSPAVMQDFSNIHSFSARGAWSNGSHGAQELLVKISGDPALTRRADTERTALSALLRQRAEIFTKEANEVGLKMLPYYGGFFIALPHSNPKAVCAKLMEKQIYLVAMANGVRIAVCAIPVHQMPGLAASILAAMKEVEG
ncbi:MAG: aminotransferase class I/II-fold pyridoxal phosphate-dependent enzyme [Clostridiales bacterium]|nr:aminotransferase class I/II-fold pyridoxal phosphate-dependent enzyme [Clostridiales bacterium]